MFEILAKAFMFSVEIYAGLGLIFAVSFVCIGVQRLDSDAEGSGIGFRLLILPGVAAFWPMFMYRWTQGLAEPPVEKTAHRLLDKR